MEKPSLAESGSPAERIYLLFDMDWAPDPALEETFALLAAHQAAATFFVTNHTRLLPDMAAWPWLELGLHPAFNINGDRGPEAPAPAQVMAELFSLVPGARSVRGHSLVGSTPLLEMFARLGLTHEISTFIPMTSGMALRPWRLWNGLVRVPFFWEDDINCLYGNPWQVAPYLAAPGLKVFAFHPIHIYLNTWELADYQAAKACLSDTNKLHKLRRQAHLPGAASFLRQLLRLAHARGLIFGKIGDMAIQ
jgi:hypothetical protein